MNSVIEANQFTEMTAIGDNFFYYDYAPMTIFQYSQEFRILAIFRIKMKNI